jgi:hypothetical protein
MLAILILPLLILLTGRTITTFSKWSGHAMIASPPETSAAGSS